MMNTVRLARDRLFRAKADVSLTTFINVSLITPVVIFNENLT